MDNYNGNREEYMRNLDQDAYEKRHREQEKRRALNVNNSSRFDRPEDEHWSSSGHGHNSDEQYFMTHPHSKFPESGVNFDIKGNHAGRGPSGYTRSDERIFELVCERLMEDDEVDASQLEVKVENRKVILSGSLENEKMKYRTEEIVKSISGIEKVENLLNVKDQRHS